MKTTDKAKFASVEPKPCPQTISQLKRFLRLAMEGKIKNVFVIAELSGGEDPMFAQAGEHDPVKTLGLLDWAKSRWRDDEILNYVSDQDDDPAA